jgi:hypothetical protein
MVLRLPLATIANSDGYTGSHHTRGVGESLLSGYAASETLGWTGSGTPFTGTKQQ